MKLFARLIWSLLALLFPAVAVTATAQEKSTPPPAAATEAAPSGAYLRIEKPGTGLVQLQVAARKYTPVTGVGPAVWLIAASHLGETNYYQALQKQLATHGLVLFEGVGFKTKHELEQGEKESGNTQEHHQDNVTESRPIGDSPIKSTGGKNKASGMSSLQANLAKALGLVFQLEAIDYEQPNFQNSDLSIPQIQRLMDGLPPGSTEPTPEDPAPLAGADPSTKTDASAPASSDGPSAGETPEDSNKEFNQLLGIMNGSSFLGSIANIGVRLISSSPQLQAVTKLTLIETLGRLKGDISQMRGVPPGIRKLMEVLISERNKVVIQDLRKELRKPHPPSSIAVFYGAGHMNDLEGRVKRELHYQPGEEVWLTAISLDIKAAGLDPAQVEMIQSMIKLQMDQMMPQP
jgi:hypothetical protein